MRGNVNGGIMKELAERRGKTSEHRGGGEKEKKLIDTQRGQPRTVLEKKDLATEHKIFQGRFNRRGV